MSTNTIVAATLEDNDGLPSDIDSDSDSSTTYSPGAGPSNQKFHIPRIRGTVDMVMLEVAAG